MGVVDIYEGQPQTAECSDYNGLNMVVGKVIKGGDELWIDMQHSDEMTSI
jgi:hypothetical protein